MLAAADEAFGAIREREQAVTGRLRVGVAPPARYSLAPTLLSACAAARPGIMIHTREEPTGALIHGLRGDHLDLAIAFCPVADAGLRVEPLKNEPVVVHVPDTHALAARTSVALDDLRGERVLVPSGADAIGFSHAVGALCDGAGLGVEPIPGAAPDIVRLAVRTGAGVLIFIRAGAARSLDGVTAIPIEPRRKLPFALIWRLGDDSPALRAVLDSARAIRDASSWLATS